MNWMTSNLKGYVYKKVNFLEVYKKIQILQEYAWY